MFDPSISPSAKLASSSVCPLAITPTERCAAGRRVEGKTRRTVVLGERRDDGQARPNGRPFVHAKPANAGAVIRKREAHRGCYCAAVTEISRPKENATRSELGHLWGKLLLDCASSATEFLAGPPHLPAAPGMASAGVILERNCGFVGFRDLAFTFAWSQ